MPDLKNNLLQGKWVKLVTAVPAEDGIILSDWTRDSGFFRLAMNEPARLRYGFTQEKYIEEISRSGYIFMIVSLVDGKKIGSIDLGGINQTSGHAWLGVGIGERAYWGKGYGSEAVGLMLDFAFLRLNFHRISLSIFEYNPRAIRAYEKVGFKFEGRKRKALLRDGHRWDLIYMGILKDEWLSIASRTK